jgi:hypothetical protein
MSRYGCRSPLALRAHDRDVERRRLDCRRKWCAAGKKKKARIELAYVCGCVQTQDAIKRSGGEHTRQA